MADELPQRRTDELNRRWRRYSRRGVLASVLFHILVFLFFRSNSFPPSPFAAAGPRAGDDRAAAGGGMQAVAIQLPRQPEEIVRPPDPIPVPDAVVPEVEEPEPEIEPVEFGLEGLASGPEKGPDEGPGREGGTGRGDGGTAMEGRFRLIPPSPRGLILPPSDRPGKVRGRDIEVWVFVTETGRVVPDSTRLRPPTGDPGFDARLRRQAAEWVFEPARRGGKPVAEWFQYVVTL